MPAGLQVFNDFGTTQIDENWKNYGFRQKFSVPLSAGPTDQPVPVQLPLTGVAPLVAVRAGTLMPIPMHSHLDGSSWIFNWRFYAPFINQIYNETVDFYVFDVPWSGGFSNVGIEVFNASGERVYHSDMPVMTVPSGGVQPCNAGFSGASGRIYAPLVLMNPARAEVEGPGFRHWSRALRVSGADILSSDWRIGTAALVPAANEGLYAAVDVTGLS